MNKRNKIYIAGHTGLAGASILRKLRSEGFLNILLRTHKELDLTNQNAVNSFFEREKPEYIFLCAAKVGGILANSTYPADFLYINLMIQSNIIHASYLNNVKKLLFLGSSCIYPKECPQPMKEEYLLSGYLEPTNETYALAKISGIKMCQAYNKQYGTNFICAMPTNLYGPNDNFDIKTSHVLPALIRKFHEAKTNNQETVELWGSGNPTREFMHSDDLASASLFLMKTYNKSKFINIGTGKEISIRELAFIIKDITGFTGKITFNTEIPDGTLKKMLDVSKIKSLGWKAKIDFREGVTNVYEWYKKNESLKFP